MGNSTLNFKENKSPILHDAPGIQMAQLSGLWVLKDD